MTCIVDCFFNDSEINFTIDIIIQYIYIICVSKNWQNAEISSAKCYIHFIFTNFDETLSETDATKILHPAFCYNLHHTSDNS